MRLTASEFPHFGPDLSETKYHTPSFSNSKSIPSAADFLPP